jgi:hypothetical protein
MDDYNFDDPPQEQIAEGSTYEHVFDEDLSPIPGRYMDAEEDEDEDDI